MNKIQLWLKAVRAPFFTASIVSVILGAVVAWNLTGEFHLLKFFLTNIGVIFVHAGTDLINDYFDHISNLDEQNKNFTPFSGGSRVIQNREISPKSMLFAGLLSFVIAAIIGFYLNAVTTGNIILYIGIIGFFIGYFYTAKPFKLGYTALGELITTIACGPLIVYGAYFVMAENHAIQPLLISVPIGILVGLILYINEFPDYEADKKVGKRTIVVILGKAKAIRLYYAFMIINYIWVIIGVILNYFPIYTLLILLTFPLCLKAIKVASKNYDKIKELLPANASTIGLHLIFGILLSVGYVLDKLI
ncbi:MAG: prenyltransferase [Candidatus Cloacimonetes bacterium]|nr:prenyltransferase [Candidatus Cloacimonadota bacterium]